MTNFNMLVIANLKIIDLYQILITTKKYDVKFSGNQTQMYIGVLLN